MSGNWIAHYSIYSQLRKFLGIFNYGWKYPDRVDPDYLYRPDVVSREQVGFIPAVAKRKADAAAKDQTVTRASCA